MPNITPQEFAALEHAMEAADAEPRKPVLTGPKRQHYLPRFYIDGFAKDGLVAVYDRKTDEVRLQQPVNTAVIGHFYTMEDKQDRRRFEVEALLSEYEGKASPVIKKLSTRQTINADERTDLAIFMALGAMRTPDIVESLQHMNSTMIVEIAKHTFANVDQVTADLRGKPENASKTADELRAEAQLMDDIAQNGGIAVETQQKWAVAMAIKMSLKVAPIFAGRNWTIAHRNSAKKSYVTTDAPVFLTSVEARAKSIYGVGFGTADAFVAFPLTQSCVLMMHGTDGSFRHVEADSEKVRRTNLALTSGCKRFVVGRDEALVRSLAKEVGLSQQDWRSKFQLG